jgi:hypothetical protein
MATSPIYNWPEPDNTDLVKNGALAIRTLGDAIDTTMATMTPKSIVDAKGDLIAATAADTPARLAVGGNNTFLRANSSASTGLEWAGAYTTFTGVSAGGWTLGNGTAAGRYLQIGKMVHMTMTIELGSTSSISGAMFISFPVTANTAANGSYLGNVRALDTGVIAYSGFALQNSGDNFFCSLSQVNSTFASESFYTSTNPFTWATGDRVYVSLTYEAA